MKVRMMVVALIMAAGTTLGPTAAAAPLQGLAGYEIATITMTSVQAAPAVATAAGPTGENLLCDKFYAFADEGGQFTLQQPPHVEAAGYIFHGTFPDSPDGTMITYADHYAFRHDISGGGDVNIDVEGAFTATESRA